MPKRRTSSQKYIAKPAEEKPAIKPSMLAVAMRVPTVVDFFDISMIKQHQEKPNWSLYKIEFRDNIPYIVREMCDRCGKVLVPPSWRKLRAYTDPDIGIIYLETGLCKDCINAGTYVDKYLDGEVLTEKEAKELFYEYARDYERAWRIVIAAAPHTVMTEKEWLHRCKFFGGCAMCGGPIEVRAKYFPIFLNGAHTAWNVIPLCSSCLSKHYAGRISKGKVIKRYRVFSTLGFFNKSKMIRRYLLHEMEVHNIYMEPLEPFRRRFFETKAPEGSKHDD